MKVESSRLLVYGNFNSSGTVLFTVISATAGRITVSGGFSISGNITLRTPLNSNLTASNNFVLFAWLGATTNGNPRLNLPGNNPPAHRSRIVPNIGGGSLWLVYVPNARGRNGAIVVPKNTAYVFAAADFGFSELTGGAQTLNAVKITSLPTNGTLTNNSSAVSVGQFISASDISNGYLVFTPVTNATGVPYDSFTFQVQDNGGTSGGRDDTDPDPKTMTISVTPTGYANTAPSGTDNTISAIANAPYTFSASDFGFSDPTRPDSGLRAVKITSLPSSGMLFDNGILVTTGQFVDAVDVINSAFVYVPAENSSGDAADSFTFQVQDLGGTASGGVDLGASANTLTIDIADAPVLATGVNAELAMDGTDDGGLFADATNFNPSTLDVTAVNGSGGNVGTSITTTQGGSLTVNSDGSFDYLPASNFIGTDSFTYDYGDGTLTGSATATIYVTDLFADDPEYSTLKNAAITTVAGTNGLLEYADAASGNSLAVTEVNGSSGNVGTNVSLSHGTLNVASDGSFTFTPTTGYTGDQTFTATIDDGLETQTETVTLHVSQLLADDSEFSLTNDQTLTVSSGSGLVTYASDANSYSLTVSAVDGDSGAVGNPITTDAGGTLTVSSNGSFVYDPPSSSFVGDDLFSYTVSNGSQTNTAFAIIHVYQPAAVSAVTVNGGDPQYLDANGLAFSLAGQNSVVEQILVTFNEPVTLDSGAFSIINNAAGVTVNSGPAPSTQAVSASFIEVPGSDGTQFIVTFSGAGTIAIPGGTGNVIKNGLYILHTDGSKVHANGFTAPADNDTGFWALFGDVTYHDISGVDINVSTGYVGDGYSDASVGSADYALFVATYNSTSDNLYAPPYYYLALDFNLDGSEAAGDYVAFNTNYNADWQF
jgi:Bacterial Ig domain